MRQFIEFINSDEVPAGLAEAEARTPSHPVVRELYRGRVSRRTVDRDLKRLVEPSLITIAGGRIQANLDFCGSLPVR